MVSDRSPRSDEDVAEELPVTPAARIHEPGTTTLQVEGTAS